MLFCLPYFPINGLYEAVCIIFLFPLLVAAGAGGQVGPAGAKLCKFLGNLSYPLYITQYGRTYSLQVLPTGLSYPLYITHYPFIYLYTSWVINRKPTPAQALPVAAGLLVGVLLLGYAALKLYDEPVRSWLKRQVSPPLLQPRPESGF